MFDLKSSRLSRRKVIAASLSAALPLRGARAERQTIEVVHWWVSGGEGDAIRTIRRRVEADGSSWVDTAVPGPDLAKTAALTRVLGGNAPTVMLWHAGSDLADLIGDGVIRDIESQAGGWDAVIPAAIAPHLKVGGQYVAAPVDLHCGNWTFANTNLLRESGTEVPVTWPAVLDACARLRRAGVVPVAFGGQAWQESSVFVMILAGVGGARLLRRLTVVHDLGPGDDPDLAAAFEIFAALKPFVDSASPNRSSTDTANLFATNKAALYFSGDWSRGDLNKAGMRPVSDYECRPAPGNDGIFMAVVDAFCMPRSNDPVTVAAQDSFARLVMNPDMQHDFNLVKGSIPIRTDVAINDYDQFARASAAMVRGSGEIVPSTSMGMSSAMRLGFYEVVHRFWNTDAADPKTAARDFRAAIDRNRG
jgi:glucose/mannose transport system substrate-binding protein